MRRPRLTRTVRVVLGGLAVAVLASGLTLGLGHVFAGWLSVRGADAGTTPGRAAAPVRHPPLTNYRDPQGRFAVSYPKTWRQLPSTDPDVALVARARGGSQNSLLVRVSDLPTALDPAHLRDAKKVTDALVANSDVRVLVQKRVRLAGLPGFYYLYTFGKPGSARFGIHAHYFAFDRSTMYVLVLQALPDTDFIDLAPTFDRIARSFTVPTSPR